MIQSHARPSSPEIARLREAVAARVEATSLRAVARNVGMGPSALDRFLGGSVPYSRTRSKLEAAVAAEARGPREDVHARDEVLLGALVRDLAPERRRAGTARLVGCLVTSFVERRIAVPPWLGRLSVEWAP
jgi:hypothetical protein